jgi:hypothetical protein
MGDQSPTKDEALRSMVTASIMDKVEEEKCVVAQYRTTTQQKKAFSDHLTTCPKNKIAIEWVIDIADESNGWFYGTAYHFDDTTQMLHVMVPDKENPSFDGQVLLDHRTVHLIECADGKSDALFNKIVRDSVIKVKWDVEWFEEVEDGAVAQDWGTAEGLTGNWVFSSARYYIRIANQLLVEDKDSGQDTRGFVILTADMNLKLILCHKNRGVEDFNRLVVEGTVQSTPEAAELAKQGVDSGSAAKKKKGGGFSDALSPSENAGIVPVRRLSEMSRGLREALSEMLDDRERNKKDQESVANMFSQFTLDGDLDMGLKLVEHFEKVKKATSGDFEEDTDLYGKGDLAADEAWYLAQKIEKSLVKHVRSTNA